MRKFEKFFKLFMKDFSDVLTKENSKPDNEEIVHITYKLVSILTNLKDYSKVLVELNLQSEISNFFL